MEPKQLIDRPEADTALMLELEEKITRRIREQIFGVMNGVEPVSGTMSAYDLSIGGIQHAMQVSLLNNPHFIRELTKAVGQKMASIF